MIRRNFKYEGCFIFSKRLQGIGFHLELNPPFTTNEKHFTLVIDILFIRFWIHSYK